VGVGECRARLHQSTPACAQPQVLPGAPVRFPTEQCRLQQPRRCPADDRRADGAGAAGTKGHLGGLVNELKYELKTGGRGWNSSMRQSLSLMDESV
jgi:hypothetical protein